MTDGRKFEFTVIAHAKASAKRARVVSKAMSRIHSLCNQALAAKIPLDFESTVAALRVAVKHV
jgi:hypothetical protein